MDNDAEKMAKKLFEKAANIQPEDEKSKDFMSELAKPRNIDADDDQHIIEILTVLLESIKSGETEVFDGPDGRLFMKYDDKIFLVKEPHMEKFLRSITDPH
jgi:hypothetical protein